MRALALVLTFTAGLASAGPPPPLDEATRAALLAIPQDPPPKEITRGMHYYVSNEDLHYLWRERVEGIGGVYVGVGAEQNYLVAGWSRPDVLVLMDFDEHISWVHEVHGLVFRKCETPDQYIKFWGPKRKDDLTALIDESWGAGSERARRAHKMLKRAHWKISTKLRVIRHRYRKLKTPCFINDQAQYDHLRQLWLGGRVLPIRGDLTAGKAMAGIAAFAKAHKLPIGVVYLSNAEYYFDFGHAQYTPNILGFDFAPRGVVLRTVPRASETYRYYVQSGADFQTWLRSGRVKNVFALTRGSARRSMKFDRLIKKLPSD